MNDMHLISVEAEARHYCDRHEIRDPDACQRVLHSMRHRAFLEAIEPISAQKRQCLNLFMATQPIVRFISRDGLLEPEPLELPAQVKELLATLDEAIVAEARRWGFDTSQVRTT